MFRTVIHNQCLNDIIGVLGMTFEEYDKSDHPDYDLFEGFRKDLKNLFKIPDHMYLAVMNAMETYKHIIDKFSAELKDVPHEYSHEALGLKHIYKLEYIPNVQAVEAIEKNFDRIKDPYAR